MPGEVRCAACWPSTGPFLDASPCRLARPKNHNASSLPGSAGRANRLPLCGRQKFHQRLIEHIGCFEMWHVAEIWQQHEFAFRNRVADVLGKLWKICTVFLTAEFHRRHFDVSPIVD